MRIAVDAMGGDFAPREPVLGAAAAAWMLDNVTKIILVGDEDAIKRELRLAKFNHSKIEVLHASETVAMAESPAQAIRRKKDSSISKAIDLVKNGEADAMVSAGNTGAVVVAATLKLRTLEGVERPAIATAMPTKTNKPVLLIDAGANTDCTAKWLEQFAVMGSIYSRVILKQETPVVGLLSIGGEESKGNEVTKEAFGALSKLKGIKFKGNVEGHDLFKGEMDVVVCDGFVGNVVLKTSESVAGAVAHWMKQEFSKNPIRMAGAFLLKGALEAMKKRIDPETYGGAPLLGVQGICIIAHGVSSGRAVLNAIRVAAEAAQNHLDQLIKNEISGTHAS
jgi:glycerol-3-phosphate acyltransferase PlsX